MKQVLAIILFFVTQCFSQDRANRPLRGDEILSLLAANASESRLARMVQERGIDFEFGSCAK